MRHKCLGIILLAAFSSLTGWGRQSVVPADISGNPHFRLVSSFIDRYMELLDESPSEKTADAIRRTKEDGFKYTVGNDMKLKNLSGNEDFSVSFNNDHYEVGWSKDDKMLVECIIPANYGLLTFTNKVELEKMMVRTLQNPGPAVSRPRPAEMMETLEKVPYSDLYVKNRGYYFVPRMKNQTVYAVNAEDAPGACSMLIDNDRYQQESIANILLSGYTPFPLNAKVKVKQYGYKTQTVDIPFPALYDILSAENSSPYWGVETFDGSVVKGLYIWTNMYGGYIHVMTVSVPTAALTQPADMEVTLHCYIRTDNLKSLFDEYPQL